MDVRERVPASEDRRLARPKATGPPLARGLQRRQPVPLADRQVERTTPVETALELSTRMLRAVGEPGAWVTFLAGVADALDTDVSVLHSPVAGGTHVIAAYGANMESLCRNTLPAITSSSWPRPDRASSGIYVGGLDPSIDAELGFFATLVARPRSGGPAMLSAVRARSRGPFTDSEAHLLRLLGAPLERAFVAFRELSVARETRVLLGTLSEHCGIGVGLLGADAIPMFLTADLHAMVAGRDGLFLDELGAVRAADRRSDRALSEALAATTLGDIGTSHVVVVARAADSSPLLLVVLPFRRSSPDGQPHCALVMTRTRSRAHRTNGAMIQVAFGLTPTEAEVAAGIARGSSLASVADGLGVSINTARTHLRRAFAKTGTSRQGELVALVRDQLAPLFL